MAKGRLVSTSFWTDSKIVDDFLPEDKYLYLYCLTNPHTNLCGCYEVSIKQISDETGYDRDTVARVLQRLDEVHGVVQYSAKTKELLICHWSRYNWSASDKLNRPLLGEIQGIKNVQFRAFVAELYNARPSVTVPFECAAPVETALEPAGETAPAPKKKERHKYGQYGWVQLTDEGGATPQLLPPLPERWTTCGSSTICLEAKANDKQRNDGAVFGHAAGVGTGGNVQGRYRQTWADH